MEPEPSLDPKDEMQPLQTAAPTVEWEQVQKLLWEDGSDSSSQGSQPSQPSQQVEESDWQGVVDALAASPGRRSHVSTPESQWDDMFDNLCELSQQESIATDLAEAMRTSSSDEEGDCQVPAAPADAANAFCPTIWWADLLREHAGSKWPSTTNMKPLSVLSGCSGSFSEGCVLEASSASARGSLVCCFGSKF